jgi:hypothetical protein
MNQNITPRSREPDELDELAECAKVVFNIFEALHGQAAQERDLRIAEHRVSELETMAERQRSRCQDPARCNLHRCRRRRRCGQLEETATMVAAARAKVAARRAWLQQAFPDVPPPSSPTAQSGADGHKKGRTRVRP